MTTNTPSQNQSKQEVEFSLRGIHEHLLCRLCSGYYKEPYTVTECLHTFCKSCLYYATAAGCNYCVICKVYLGNDVEKFAALDFSMQRLVDTIIMPEVRREEDHQEVQFYKEQGIQMKPEHAAAQEGGSGGAKRSTGGDDPTSKQRSVRSTDSPKRKRAHKSSHTSRSSHGGNGSNSSSSAGNNADGEADAQSEIDVILLPARATGSQRQRPSRPLTHPCLSVSKKMKMSQVKKYLRMQFQDEAMNIEIMCNDVPLGDEVSLGFIQRLVWAQQTELELTYRIEQPMPAQQAI